MGAASVDQDDTKNVGRQGLEIPRQAPFSTIERNRQQKLVSGGRGPGKLGVSKQKRLKLPVLKGDWRRRRLLFGGRERHWFVHRYKYPIRLGQLHQSR